MPDADNDTEMLLDDQAEEIEHLRGVIRAIELRVDALNIKGFTPRPAEKAAFEDIKSRCRDALKR